MSPCGPRPFCKRFLEAPDNRQACGCCPDEIPAVRHESRCLGLIQLTPIQHWFFEQELERRHHWNQAFLFEVSHDIDLAILGQSLRNGRGAS